MRQIARALTEGKPVILGRVTGLYGVKGWLKVHSYTEPREAILDYKDWSLLRDGSWQSFRVAEGKRKTARQQAKDEIRRMVECPSF